jgi:hypothetical protein
VDERDPSQPPVTAPEEETVGTGSALALGCVLVTVVLILLGALFFLLLWLLA